MSERDQSGDTPDIVERLEEAAESSQWHVFFSNYYPQEVDSVWDTEEGARARASSLDGDWNVEPIGDNPNAELLRDAAQTIKDLRGERDDVMRRFSVAMAEKNLEIGSLRSRLQESVDEVGVLSTQVVDVEDQRFLLRSRLQEAEKVVAAIDPTKLRLLADFIDKKYPDDANPEVQTDLRKWADLLATFDSTLGGKTDE